MEFDRRHRDTGDISLTPVIDMVFLLLIFFLLTSSFMKVQGISVDLPASASPLQPKEESITVCISADAKLFINSRRTDLKRLPEDLQAAYVGAGTKDVIIQADKSNSVQVLMQVMDAVNLSGADSLTLAADVQPISSRN